MKLDEEFKLFLRWRGFNIDTGLFSINFNPPQNFAAYRQTEMDTARVTTYGAVSAIPHLSKRFALKRFLGLTAEEMAENETMWKEENVDADAELPATAELRSAGVTPSGMSADMSAIGGATTPPPDDTAGTEAGTAPAATPPPA
jgi:hypothetical protein